MKIEDTEKWVDLFRKKPKKALLYALFLVILVLATLILTPYLTGFFGEKGKQAAGPTKHAAPEPASTQLEQEQPKLEDKLVQKSTEVFPPPEAKTKAKRPKGAETKEAIKPQTGDDRGVTVNQKTQGDQSPAVNVGTGGTSTIIYGAPKKEGAKE